MEQVAVLAAESNVRKELLSFMQNALQIVLGASVQAPAVRDQVIQQLRAAGVQLRDKAMEPIPPQPWLPSDAAAAATQAQRAVIQAWFEPFDAELADFAAYSSQG